MKFTASVNRNKILYCTPWSVGSGTDGDTTENPSFEVIQPLLSRCRVFVLKPLDKAGIGAPATPCDEKMR